MCLSFQQICNRDGAQLEQQDSGEDVTSGSSDHRRKERRLGGDETPQDAGADMLELLKSVAVTVREMDYGREGVYFNLMVRD
ncbi:transcription termination factor Rho [Sesbania bispinosa]|nr:transcription termination factor Rho [Sesbania bispinosa]